MAQNGTRATGPRCIALVGPFQSGKTTLLEAILARTGAIQRQGTVDAAVIVCELDEKKVPQLQLILRELEEQQIPRFLFLNKIDKADSTIHEVLRVLQPASRGKLLLRQIPTLSGDIITGFVDLALERAFVYK